MRFESVARVTVIGVDVYMYISFKRFVCYSAFSGPAQGGGGGGGRSPTLKKKKLRNTQFQIKGIFDRIRIFVWRTSPKHQIYDWSVSILYHQW